MHVRFIALLVAAILMPRTMLSEKLPDLPSGLRELIQEDYTDSDSASCFAATKTTLEGSFLITKIEIGPAGEEAVAVRGWRCLGGAQTGPFNVYVQDQGRWRRVLSTWGSGAKPRDSRSRLWRDIEILGHISASEYSSTVFQFNGDTYVARYCQIVLTPEGAGKPTGREICDGSPLPMEPR